MVAKAVTGGLKAGGRQVLDRMSQLEGRWGRTEQDLSRAEIHPDNEGGLRLHPFKRKPTVNTGPQSHPLQHKYSCPPQVQYTEREQIPQSLHVNTGDQRFDGLP